MKIASVILLLSFLISMFSYDSGYDAGTADATKNITGQFTTDLENVLLEGQYHQIPNRTMILFENIHVLR